jgi:hypothetical protein
LIFEKNPEPLKETGCCGMGSLSGRPLNGRFGMTPPSALIYTGYRYDVEMYRQVGGLGGYLDRGNLVWFAAFFGVAGTKMEKLIVKTYLVTTMNDLW